MSRVIVIGGGVGGLAAAALAARDGHHVTLLERHAEVGGRARVWRTDGFVFDTGPSWWLMPEVFDALFDRLEIAAEARPRLERLEPGYRIYHPDQAQPLDISADRDALHATWNALDASTSDALDDYLDSATHTYRLALERYLYTDFSSLAGLAKGLSVKDVVALGRLLPTSLHRYVSRRFRHPIHRAILEYPAIFLGTDPKEAPALYHLMSHLDLVDGVQYPHGGFGQLVDTLETACRDAGVEIITGVEVTGIHTAARGRAKSGWNVTGVSWQQAGEHGATTSRGADAVLNAGSSSELDTLLSPNRLTASTRITKPKPGMAAVVASIGVAMPLPNVAHHTFLFSADWDNNMDRVFGREADDDPTVSTSLYVSRPSATDSSLAPAGSEALFVLIPVGRRAGAGGVDGAGDAWVEARVDAALGHIEETTNSHGLRDHVVVRRTFGPSDFERDYNSVGGALLGPAHSLRQSGPLRGAVRVPGIAGLYLVGGTTRPGVGLPMVLISAEVAVDALAADSVSEQHAVPGAHLPDGERGR